MMYSLHGAVLCVLAAAVVMQGDARTCRDEEGNPVDWFIVLKLPQHCDETSETGASEDETSETGASEDETSETGASEQVQEGKGYRYMYMDAHHPEPIESKNLLNESNHAIAHTLNQIYKNRDSMDSKEESHLNNSPSCSSLKDKDNDVDQLALKLFTVGLNNTSRPIATTSQKNDSHDSKDVGYLMYNDALPQDMDNSDTKLGHAKGVLAFDASGGFWLMHSTPRFPRKATQSYNWPDSAKKYGQSFLCITFGFDQFQKIGEQLMYINPRVYNSYIPSKLATDVPSLVKVTQEEKVTSAPWNRRVSLTSRGGKSFISFAKSSEYGKDIYSPWLAEHLKSNLLVETWQNGVGKMDSFWGGSYDVVNIREMTLGSEAFRQTKDHSKWAVTDSEGSKWICIGDINRMDGQKKRGGGIVCFENKSVHKCLRDGITKTDERPESEQTLPRPRVTQPVPQNMAETPPAPSTDNFLDASLDQQNQRTGIDEGKN